MHPLIKSFIDSASFNCMLTVSQELYCRLGQRRQAPGGSVRGVLRTSPSCGDSDQDAERTRDRGTCQAARRAKTPPDAWAQQGLSPRHLWALPPAWRTPRGTVSQSKPRKWHRIHPHPRPPEPEVEATSATQGQTYPRSVWFGANMEASYILQPG